jgi:hypothetical protein
MLVLGALESDSTVEIEHFLIWFLELQSLWYLHFSYLHCF